MKKIFISRKAIFRAIRLASLALLLLFWTQRAEAQMYSAPFLINGSTVTTSSGTYGNGAGLYEPGANFGSVTIGAQTSVNATVSYAASDGLNQALLQTSTSSFSNSGTVSLATTNSGAYQAAIYLDQGSLSLTASNSGTISATSGGSTNEALFLNSTSGNLAFTNTGTGSIYSNGSNNNNGVLVTAIAGGNVTINNNQGGSITIGPSAANAVVEASASGGGAIAINNAGTVSGNSASLAGDGIVGQADSGAVQVLNSGTVSNVNYGVSASSNSGSVTVTNTGSINASQLGVGVGAGFSVATVINSGTITGSGYTGLAVYGNSIVVRNSGNISGTGTGSNIYQYNGPGTVQFLNSGTITVGGDGVDIAANPSTPITVSNSGAINSGGTGIMLSNPGTVTNSGSITGATAAINVPSGSSVILQGSASASGTIVGGSNSASLSTLSFALSIPSSQYAAAQSQLTAEIAAYAAQMGGAYTFDIDGRTFDILNFLSMGGVMDDLVPQAPALMYASVPGYQSLGTVLDNLNPSSPQATNILNALANVPDANIAAALAELSPKELEIFRNVAFDNNTFNATQINNHLANLRDGLTGFDSGALTVQDSSMDPTLNQINIHLLAYNPSNTPGLLSDSTEPIFGANDAKDMKEMNSAQMNTMPTERWSSFIAGNVILADLSNNANLEDQNYTTGSVTAGVDYRLDEHFTVGALFAYAHTSADLDSRGSSATVDSYSPGLYASYVDGGWYGNGMATYNRNAYTDDREVDIPGLPGDNHGGTSGNQGDLNLTGGYEFHRGAFKFGPVASAEYVHLQIDSLQEQGPTALNIGNQKQDSFRSLLGFEGRFETSVITPIGPVALTPHASASWQHEYLDNSDGITSQFNGTGGGSFVTQTDSPDRDSAFLDVGLDAKVMQNVTLFIDYSAQAGQQNFFAQSAQGGVKIGF